MGGAAQTKICTKCGQEKPATAEYFNRQKTKPDGLRSHCKDCRKDEHKKYYAENYDAMAAYRAKNAEKQRNYMTKYYQEKKDAFKKYRQKNKESRKQYMEKYRDDNKEALRVYSKKKHQKYYKQNREAILEYQKKYYEQNKEAKKEYQKKLHKEYCKKPEFRESCKLRHQRRRSLKNNLPSTLTARQWRSCKERFNQSCAYCGKKLKRLHQEHFVPLASGGGYTVNNIIPACGSCNCSKQNKDFFDWYPVQPFYSVFREKRILKYLNIDKKSRTQQTNLLEIVREA